MFNVGCQTSNVGIQRRTSNVKHWTFKFQTLNVDHWMVEATWRDFVTSGSMCALRKKWGDVDPQSTCHMSPGFRCFANPIGLLTCDTCHPLKGPRVLFGNYMFGPRGSRSRSPETSHSWGSWMRVIKVRRLPKSWTTESISTVHR